MASFYGADVVWEVSVAFTTDPLATPTWVDITAYTQDRISVSYGRRQTTGMFEPGVCSVVCDNQDRLFDPLHTAGTYYGNLLPNKRVRIRATYDSTTYDVFYGFVDRWVQNPREQTATLVATDATKLLAGWECPDSVWYGEVVGDSPSAWYRFDNGDGDTVLDWSGNRNHAQVPANLSEFITDPLIKGTSDGAITFPIIRTLNEVAIPKSVTGTVWSIECWVSFPVQAPSYGSYIYFAQNGEVSILGGYSRSVTFIAQVGVYVSSAAGEIKWGRPNHIVCVRDGANLYLYVNGAEVTSTSSGTPSGSNSPIGANYGDGGAVGSASVSARWQNGVFDDLVLYDTALSAADVLAHYEAGYEAWEGDDTGERIVHLLDTIGWPSALRAIDVDQTASLLGPAYLEGSVLGYCQTCAATEDGWLYMDHRDGGKVTFLQRYAMLQDTRHTTSQQTFTDEEGAGTHYYDATLIYDDTQVFNDITVTFDGGVVNVTDATSITAYGRRSLTVNSFCRYESEATALANWKLHQLKDPQVRVSSLRFRTSGSTTLLPGMLARRIGDRVTFSTLPQNTGSRYTAEMWVDSISHDVNHTNGTWDTVLSLTPCLDAADYWRWGQDTWDDETRWAY